jgi:hypothetical protein
VYLTEESQTFFGFQWREVYYVYTVLSFGWKIAPIIYNSFSGELAGYTRRMGIRSLYLLDDSLVLPLTLPTARLAGSHPMAPAHSAAYVVVAIKVGLGYFVHPIKSVLSPATQVDWLGLTIQFSHRRFVVPDKKVAAI